MIDSKGDTVVRHDEPIKVERPRCPRCGASLDADGKCASKCTEVIDKKTSDRTVRQG